MASHDHSSRSFDEGTEEGNSNDNDNDNGANIDTNIDVKIDTSIDTSLSNNDNEPNNDPNNEPNTEPNTERSMTEVYEYQRDHHNYREQQHYDFATATTSTDGTEMRDVPIPALADSIDTVETGFTGSPRKEIVPVLPTIDSADDAVQSMADDSMPSGAIPSVDSTAADSAHFLTPLEPGHVPGHPPPQFNSLQPSVSMDSVPSITPVPAASDEIMQDECVSPTTSLPAACSSPPTNNASPKTKSPARMLVSGLSIPLSCAQPSPETTIDTRLAEPSRSPRRLRQPQPMYESGPTTEEGVPPTEDAPVLSRRIGAAPPRPVTPSRSRPTTPTTPGRSTNPQSDTQQPAKRLGGVDAIRLSLVENSPAKLQQKLKDVAASPMQSSPMVPMTFREDPESMALMMAPTAVAANTQDDKESDTEDGDTASEVIAQQRKFPMKDSPSSPQPRSHNIRIIRDSFERERHTKARDSATSEPQPKPTPSAGNARFGMSPEDWEAKQRAKYGPQWKAGQAKKPPIASTPSADTHTASTVLAGTTARATTAPGAVSVSQGESRPHIRISGSASNTNDADMMEAKRKAREERDSSNRRVQKIQGRRTQNSAAMRSSVQSTGPMIFDDDDDIAELETRRQRRQHQLQNQHYKQEPASQGAKKPPPPASATTTGAVSQQRDVAGILNANVTLAPAVAAAAAPNAESQDVRISQAAIENLHNGPQYLSDDDDGGLDEAARQSTTMEDRMNQQTERMMAKANSGQPSRQSNRPTQRLSDETSRMGPSHTQDSRRMLDNLRDSANTQRPSSSSASIRHATTPGASEKSGMKISRMSHASQISAIRGGNDAVGRNSALSRRMRQEQRKFGNLRSGNRPSDVPMNIGDGRSSQVTVGSIAMSEVTMSDMGTIRGDESEKFNASTSINLGSGNRPYGSNQMMENIEVHENPDDYSDQVPQNDPTFESFETNSTNQQAQQNLNATVSVANSMSVGGASSDAMTAPASLLDAESTVLSNVGSTNATVEQAITAELVTDDFEDEEAARERVRKEEERKAEERLRNTAVVAEATVIQDEPEEDDAQGRRRMYICLGILVAIIAIVVGVVVATSGGSGGGGVAVLPTESPTFAPTPRPFNDVCELAHDLLATGAIVSTNNQNANEDDIECELENSGGGGVWYTIQGVGKRVRTSTCSGTTIDTEIKVFSGECDALSCIGGNDQLCGDQSSVGWFAEEGMTYKILVGGFRTSSRGPITLTLEEVDDISQCSLADDVSGGEVLLGSTRGVIDVAELEACGEAEAATTPSAWYRMAGDGNLRCASMLNRDVLFDSQLSVVSGTCDSLSCVGGVEVGSEDEIVWRTSNDTVYYAVVHGSNRTIAGNGRNPSSGPEGDFQVTIKFPPENTFCEGAVGLDPNGTSNIQASTVDACRTGEHPCAGVDARDPGLWYVLEGIADSIMSVSTCDQDNPRAVRLFLSRNIDAGCETQQCLQDVREVPCDGQSTLLWRSAVNETYFVMVQSNDGGEFSLSTEQITVTHECEAATLLLPEEGSVIGYMNDANTTYGVASEDGNITDVETDGMWFVFNGTGESYLLSTCDEFNEIDVDLVVFTGGCDGLQPLTAVSQNCASGMIVSFDSVLGVEYHILAESGSPASVADGGGSDGIFRVTIEPGFLGVPNDLCRSATQLEYPAGDNPVSVFGSTTNATGDDVETCGLSNSISSPVWYFVEGQGKQMRASLCSDATTFDTQIYIYSGDCDALLCVAADDDSCGDRSVVSWIAEEDETYYLLVGGHIDTGDFRLDVAEIADVE